MKYKVSLVLAFMFFNSAVLANCASQDTLGAKYLITSTHIDTKQSTNQHMLLWRNGNQVAHEYPQTHMTELWEQSSHGMLRLVRNFDAYQRAIEYQPGEINNGKGIKDWGLKYQLISEELKNKMQRHAVTGEGCDKVEKYSLDSKGSRIELEWLPNQQLIKNMKVFKKDVTLQWNLENIVKDVARVKQFFLTRNQYQTTDYIDIGDNESDPFLSKMIHLGFTKHGSSLVYETEGRSLSSHSQHMH